MTSEVGELLARRFPVVCRRIQDEADYLDPVRPPSSDWEGLLSRWQRGLSVKPNALYAISGLGDGSHLERLLDELPVDSFLFCGEPSPEAAKRFLDEDSASELLSDPRFCLGVGPLDEAFFESISRCPVVVIDRVEPIIFAPLHQQAVAYYSQFFLEFARAVDYWRKLFGTNVTGSGRWQENTIRNLPLLASQPDLGDLRGCFDGVPMVFVAAGPSLDESLDFLKTVQDRALIVAVNSSYRVLRKAGICPPVVLAADPNSDVDKGFEDVDTEGSFLLCPFMVYPEVVRRFQGRTATWSGDNASVSYLRKAAGKPLGTSVVEHGTVSACVFDVAELLGCRDVYLVGQDMAVREDGRSHAADTFYTAIGANAVDVGECRSLPGNTIANVFVEEKLFVYLKAFEHLARTRGDRLTIRNLSRSGARIQGVPYESIEIARQRLRGASPSVLTEGLVRLATPQRVRTPFLTDAQRSLAKLQEYASMALKLAARGAIVLELGCSEEVVVGEPDLQRSLRLRDRLTQHLESQPDMKKVLEDGALKYETLACLREVKACEYDPDSVAYRLHELRANFWAIAEGCFAFARTADSVLRDWRD